MDTDRWRRIGEVFEAVSGLEGEALDQALDRHCGEDEALRTEVVSLLAADRDAESWLAGLTARSGIPAPEAEAALNAPGRRIGPWRLLRLIGRGGMGVVYLAERADEHFRMQAALKALPVGLITRDAVQRFQRERDILAGLEHPHIARLIDGGVTPEGTPYYVMEYVEGLPLQRYCEEHGPGLDTRLRLFEQIALAVAYAHRHLVIHRDIKPANILVSKTGEPKLLDFGVAKLVEAEAEHTRTATQLAQRRITPAYTAPELLQGEPVTTACDVYSLGVVLYELLAGRPPFEPGFFDQPGWTERLAEYRPPPPSRAGADTALSQRLRGDLDTIVAKAMHPDPERRYATVNALLADLERHRKRLPVTARPDTAGYRLNRFLRRHAVGVGLSAALALALVGGVTVSLWQAREATLQAKAAAEAAQRAEATRDFVLRMFEAADPEEARGASLTAEQMLDAASGMLRSEADTDPELHVTLAGTIGGLYRRLGLLDKARATVAEGFMEDTMRMVNPDTRTNLLLVRARVERQAGNFEGAATALERARQFLARCTDCDQSEILVTAEQAALEHDRGYPDKALEVYESLLDYALASEHLDFHQRSGILLGYAESLGKIDEFREAERILDRARNLIAESGNPAPLREAEIWQELGVVQQLLLERESAGRSFRNAMAIREEILGRNHPATLETLKNLAGLQNLDGDYAGARSTYEDILQRLRESLGPDHPRLISVWSSIGWTHHNAGEFEAGLAAMQEAWALAERIYATDSMEYWEALGDVAWLQVLNGDYESAEPTLHRILEHNRDRFGDDHSRFANVLSSLGWMAYFRGDFAAAERYVRRVLSIYAQKYGDDRSRYVSKAIRLNRIKVARGQDKGSEEDLEELRQIAGDRAPSQEALAQLGVGQARLAQGNAEHALPMLEESFEKLDEMHGADHVLTLEARLSLAKALREVGDEKSAAKHAEFVRARLEEHAGGREYLLPRLESLTGTALANSRQPD